MYFRHDVVRDTAEILGCLKDSPTAALRRLKSLNPRHIRAQDVGATTVEDVQDSLHVALGALVMSATESAPSAFDTIARQSRRAAFWTPLFVGRGVTATVGAEGIAWPVAKYAVDGAGLVPTKVGALCPITNEALSTQQGREGLVMDLVEAIGTATDEKFLSLIASDAATTGTASADPVADFKIMLDGVNVTGFGRLHFVMSSATANTLSTWRDDLLGQFLFPDIGPQGGSLLTVPIIVSPGAGTGVYLIDAGAIVTGDTQTEIRLSDKTALEMSDDPAMDSGAPTAATGKLVSMFQTDTTAALAVRHFAAKLMRVSGAAVLTDASAWSQTTQETT